MVNPIPNGNFPNVFEKCPDFSVFITFLYSLPLEISIQIQLLWFTSQTTTFIGSDYNNTEH